MNSPLTCYYIDEPLVDEELLFVQQALVGPWATFKTKATELVQKRVPLVVPAPDANGGYTATREQRAARVRLNLRHAGMHDDRGRQVVWVTPPDPEWDAIFRHAIRAETGVAPFVVQRWIVQDNVAVRAAVRVIDTQMLIDGL